MAFSSRNNNRRRRPRQRRPTRSKNIRNRLSGATFRVNPDPTSTVDRPWNQCVLAFTSTTTGNIPVSVVNTAFQTQVGAGTMTPALDFRFMQLRAWELSGANLAVQIYDLETQTSDPHRTQHDEPGRNHWATCGLQWANPQQMVTFASTSSTNIATIASSATTVQVLIHLHIMWRFTGPPKPTLFEPHNNITISTIANPMNRYLSESLDASSSDLLSVEPLLGSILQHPDEEGDSVQTESLH